jgi:hypothetical protein
MKVRVVSRPISSTARLVCLTPYAAASIGHEEMLMGAVPKPTVETVNKNVDVKNEL